jgi:hypothetical protein
MVVEEGVEVVVAERRAWSIWVIGANWYVWLKMR